MLESGLFFTLGFLCSALVALLVAPAIWRRAVVLTRKRIESSVPLTLNEIQADKDQLRAEFAMNTRRLEVSLDKSKERVVEQKIEIGRRREEMNDLEATEAEKSGRIMELEAQAAEMRSEIKSREDQLNQTTSSLTSVQNKLDERSFSFEELDQKYNTAVDDFDRQKIEMVARETRLDTIQGEARDTREKLKSKGTEQKELVKEVKSLTASLNKQERHNLELNEKLTRLQSQSADMEGRLERRDADIARLRGKSGDKDDNGSSQLADSEKALDKLKQERDALKIELSTAQLTAEGGKNAGSRNNTTSASDKAIIRDRINNLAAQVTAITASIEGPDSPINAALAKTPKPTKRTGKSTTKSATKGNVSLADRIHALQDAAEKA